MQTPLPMKIELFYSQGDKGYVARVIESDEYKYLNALGDTPQEALKEFGVVLYMIGVK